MNTKHCTTCDTIRSVDEFHKNKRRKDGLQSWCKLCSQEWRDKPENKHRMYNNARRHRRGEATTIERTECINKGREVKVKLIESLGGACFDCGYPLGYASVFDFHHRDPNQKNFNISEKLREGKRDISQELWDEVKKCDLLCSNCHRVRHQIEGFPENAGVQLSHRTRKNR